MFISVQNRDVVVHENELEVFDPEFGKIPVIFVLGVDNVRAGHPFRHFIGAVADIGLGFCRPLVTVGVDEVFADRGEGRERRQFQEVGHGVFQGYNQSLVVGSFDIEHLVFAVITVNDIEHILIVGSRGRIDRAVPGIHEITGRYSLSVAPFEAVTKAEGVDFAVFGHFIGLCLAVNGSPVFVKGHQAFKGVDDHRGAVDRRVERRVNGVGVGSYIHRQGIRGGDGGFCCLVCVPRVVAGRQYNQTDHENRQNQSQFSFHFLSSLINCYYFIYTGKNSLTAKTFYRINVLPYTKQARDDGKPRNARTPLE